MDGPLRRWLTPREQILPSVSSSLVRHAAAAWLIPAVALLVAGCGFRTLKRDIEALAQQSALEGNVQIRGEGGHPIVVAVYTGTKRLEDFFLLPRPAPFFFALPAGTYQLVAFEDRNRDLAYQPGEEPAAQMTDLVLRPGERRSGLDLVLDPNAAVRIAFEVSVHAPGQRELGQMPAPQLGTVVSMDDPRFTDEIAKIGLWDPLNFLTTIGAGVYFLEEYDPTKTPVLFVHGAMGHPGNWKQLVAALDRSRFQPWLVYYPTAPHLDQLGRSMVRTIAALQVKYRFPRLILVAHSMGGLVTRAALNYAMQNATDQRAVHIPAFVSISSPWGGDSAAAAVKYAPVAAPSWLDMVPGSAFLIELPKTALPPECEYTLLFSYRGATGISGEANDGTVALASELSLPIQQQANAVMGFHETHTGILESREVADRLNAILLRADGAKE